MISDKNNRINRYSSQNKMDYLKTIMYGILLMLLTSVSTLVTTVLITKRGGISIVVSIILTAVIMVIYSNLIAKYYDKIGFSTDEDQKYWKVKLVLIFSIIVYVVISLCIYYMSSSSTGKLMLMLTPGFILIGMLGDIIIKKRNSV